MPQALEEKRGFPRVKANLKVLTQGRLTGWTQDLSETGARLSFSKPLPAQETVMRIVFSAGSRPVQVHSSRVWGNAAPDGAAVYGVRFTQVEEGHKEGLRLQLIKRYIEELLSSLKSLEMKTHVRRFFLTDMPRYMREAEQLELCAREAPSYSYDLEEKLERLHTEILLKGYCLDELLCDKPAMTLVKNHFRCLCSQWVSKSPLLNSGMKRTTAHPDDFRLLESIYDNKELSTAGSIGLYVDRYFLKSPYAAAVRTRKEHMKELILAFLQRSSTQPLRILNVGCGPCREIRELLTMLPPARAILFTLIDWNEDALRFSENATTAKIPAHDSVTFIHDTFMHIIKGEGKVAGLGKYDLIFSTGILDYLPQRIARNLIASLYKMLSPNGELILTHQNKEKTFPTITPEWLCGWKFYPRNKEEALHLFYSCGIPDPVVLSVSDEFSYVYYFTLANRPASKQLAPPSAEKPLPNGK